MLQKRIKQKIQSIIYQRKSNMRDFLFGKGLLSHPTLKPGKTMLIYHGVDALDSHIYNTKSIGEDRLRKQLIWLKENAEIVDVYTYLNNANAGNKHQICLTFDDGFENNYTRLLPLLEELQLPATIFITTAQMHGNDILWPDYLDLTVPHLPNNITIGNLQLTKKKGQLYLLTGQSYKTWLKTAPTTKKAEMMEALKGFTSLWKKEALNDYWRLLNEKQIVALSKNPLITLGTHGVTHDNFGSVPLQQVKQELIDSKKYLEELTGNPIDLVAHPDGSYTEEVRDLARNLGYKYQFAIDFNHASDVHFDGIENRLGINPFISWNNQVYAINRGKY